MSISLLQIIVVLIAGLAAGFINTMAGGGSFISLVALEFAGLPSVMANGTNRIAVEIGALTSVLGFKSKGVSNIKLSLHFAIPALLGSILGAYIAIDLPTAIFHRILAIAMLVMLATLLFDSEKWLKSQQIELTPARRLLIYVAFFGIGVYGGAIQAGVGFFLMAALVLLAGQDLVATNGHKTFIVSVYTLAALLLFTLSGQIHWLLGLVLSVGNGVGGWIASLVTVAKGAKIVRIVLAIMLAVMAVKYLHIIPGF